MTIPLGVNFIQFYQSAKAKGVKITSRYKGVCVGKINSGTILVWRLQYNNGKKRTTLYFPFTDKGENEAGEKYLQLKQSTNG